MTEEDREFRLIFRNNVIKRMKELDYIAMDLTLKTGISKSSISGYINLVKTPGLHNAYKIAEALGMSLDELCKE